MNIQFRQGSEQLSERLFDRASAKIEKFSRLIRETNDEPLVYIDIERESNAHENSESLWRASINLSYSGERFNASEVGSSPEKATDLAIKEMKRELRTAVKKHKAVVRRGANLFKRMRQALWS
jgi:ribosome-associated translation inhibitor RaiA